MVNNRTPFVHLYSAIVKQIKEDEELDLDVIVSRSSAIDEELDDDEKTDHNLEEAHKRLSQQQQRRGKVDITAGITDLSTGKINRLVLEFISKLKLSHADTKRKNIEEQFGDIDDNGEGNKENRRTEKEGITRKGSVTKRVRSMLIGDK